MGTFLSLTSVIGKTKEEVVTSLTNYARSVGGGVEKENLPVDSNNCCVVEEANGNTSVFYPHGYVEWDTSSEFISRDLNAPVFSFHIHDGDLWMYILFVNGKTVDQFNPVPDYWDGDISDEEIQSWSGNAATIIKYIGTAKQGDIQNYLVRWDAEEEESKKAHPDDEYEQEDWQLLDFMRKLGLPYPLDDDYEPTGDTYKLWTKELRLEPRSSDTAEAIRTLNSSNPKKPWWKFW
jgi:hypothetical protein